MGLGCERGLVNTWPDFSFEATPKSFKALKALRLAHPLA